MSKPKFNRLPVRTAQSEALQLLRDGPQLADDVRRPNGGPSRDLVCSLDHGGGGYSATKSRGRVRKIVYLYGDERRAVRKFIDENTEYVESCVDDPGNPLQDWDPVLYQMLLEEWDFRQAGADE